MVLTATIIKLCCFDAREGSSGDGKIEGKGVCGVRDEENSCDG